MPIQLETQRGEAQYQPGRSIDALVLNGSDPTATWRLHMQNQTMARQAAEQRYARQARSVEFDGPQSKEDARRRAAGLRAEMARISAEHRAWLREHQSDVIDRPRRTRITLTAAHQ